ncbi:alpha/beta hydrolase [Deinococcus irradiatisoli]|uniref:Alpha/beta hydrolase n=1 Tax=Deinococcus irradiatisoli TaxID=2202254 RepID=A0A2Z3JFH8_9DEIO|nr:alpha/beta hydrolase [Deinococcus irradiatisoli]AWN22110.1 alpha/beta hydrolase [Deinococcus irradiatisoli]
MTPTLIFVPGLGSSGPQHWQTLWQGKFGGVRVEQDDWNAPTPESWAARLHEVIEATLGDLLLVAHSAGVLTVAAYAQRYASSPRVSGALLVAPPDVERADMPQEVYPLRAVPLAALPFPALVVASENDPYATFERAAELAEAWEAELVTVGEAGHINVESGHGEWEEGEILLSEVLHAWTPPDIVRF